MKIAHIVSEIGGGGASRSALNLHFGLLGSGVHSIMLAGKIHGEIPQGVFEIPAISEPQKKFYRETQLLLAENRTDRSNTHFSLNFPGWNPLECDLLDDVDVINLHWIAECLSASSIAALASLGKPLLWTLHDMRPFTGGCHFPAGCIEYQRQCNNCPQLIKNWNGLTEKNKELLGQAIDSAGIHFIALSSWMIDCIRQSTSLSSHAVTLIPNGLDPHLFSMGDKREARIKLGLDGDSLYVLLAANNSREHRKGFSEAMSILASLKALPEISGLVEAGKIRILVCCHEANDVIVKGWTVDYVGYLDYSEMPMVYQAADLLLFTSLEDNLPNVVMEALSCGLPVVGHDLAGVRDLVGNNEKSLFPIGDTGLACSIIKKLINDESSRSLIGERGRKRVETAFSLKHQANAYLELYRKLIGKPFTSYKGGPVAREEEYRVLSEMLTSVALHYKYIYKEQKSLLYRIKNYDSELKWWCNHLYKQFSHISFYKKK